MTDKSAAAKNLAMRESFARHFLPVYAPPPPVLVAAGKTGSRVVDAAGREYIDFGGGLAVNCLGHAAPQIARAVCEQAARLAHTSNLFVNEVEVELAEKLLAATFADKIFFCNSGAEANEAALKIARRRGVSMRAEKRKVLSFGDGFHGRIGFAMAATPQAKIRAGFGPLSPDFIDAPFNDSAAAEAAADDDLCAIIVELAQGEGGVNLASDDFVRRLREIADARDALLIFDEVQTGVGRCGALFLHQEIGIDPDIVTAAKGLGGGFPIGAALVGARAADALSPGHHGTTFGGNPLACRAALAVLEVVDNPDFLRAVRARGADFVARLEALNQKFDCFADIRGRGLLLAADMKSPFELRTTVAAALEQGLIVLTAGENAMRFAPPLNIEASDIEEGFRRLQAAIEGWHKA